MIISVTQEDIDTTIARWNSSLHNGMCTNCPVAVALQRYFPEFTLAADFESHRPWTDGAHVGLFPSTWRSGGMPPFRGGQMDERYFRLPVEVQKWISQFDDAYYHNRAASDLTPASPLFEDVKPYPPVPFEFELDDMWVRWMEDLFNLKKMGVTL